jgi:glycosyltransferase involved in cell wall biosynthesis
VMKILIFHDYVGNVGGGERLVLTLARGLGADVATLDYNPFVVESLGFKDVKVIGLGTTPKVQGLKQAAASLKYALCDFRKDYDFFIFSGNWAHYAAKRHHPNLWYCHTPVRAFYSDYERIASSLPAHKRLAFRAWAGVHRVFDQAAVKGVDRIVVNSKTTQERVKRYYGRDSAVVWSGIDVNRYRYLESGDFWLSVNRLYPEKRVDLQAEAFRRMPDERLVVVGDSLPGDHSGEYARMLRANCPPNVEYRGRVSEAELVGLYGRCKGFICTALDEDLGLTPIEAMACGKPVVATGEGGYLETVVGGETGVFVAADAGEIVRAVKAVGEDPGRYRVACEARASRFTVDSLVERVRAEMDACLQRRREHINAGF